MQVMPLSASGIFSKIFLKNENFIRSRSYIKRKDKSKTQKMKYLRLRLLLEKLKSGKREYFDEFYGLTKMAVYYLVKKYLFDDFAVEDVMQEADISFLYSLDKVIGNPLPYLLQIAKNKALDYLRKDSKTDKSVQAEDLNIGKADEYESEFPLLQECRKRLDEEEFFILENTVIFGYTRVDVAKMLDKPVSTVNRKYNAILSKIKKFHKEAYK